VLINLTLLSSDVDSYEDGDGQALRDTLNRCEIICTYSLRGRTG